MKYISTLFALIFLSFSAAAQFGSIPNGGFENWSDDTLYLNPQTWQSSNTVQFIGTPAVTQSTDAQDGTSSVLISSIPVGGDTISGFVVQGDYLSGAGIPYSANFEAISFQYKSNLPAGDTLYVVVLRYNGGTPVGYQVIPAAYGNANVWTPNLVYVGNIISDELLLGFTLQDPNGFNATPGAWVKLDNIQMIAGGIQVTPVLNPSFESWEATTVEDADDWYSLNYLLGAYGLENANKTTDAYAGSYAMQMNTIDTGSDTIASVLSFSPINVLSVTPFSNAPYNGSPTLFSGAYKYSPANGDQGGISITFFENNVVIGTHYEMFSAQSSYTPFVSALTIIGTPDSIQFVAYSGDQPGSLLKLDELQFSGGGVGIFDEHLPEFALFPNPANSEAWLVLPNDQTYTVKIFAPDGRLIKELSETHGKLRFNLGEFAPGMYSVQIGNRFLQRVQKLLVD